MTDLERFQAYAALADDLLQAATPDQMVEGLKILALNLAAYKALHGEIPQTEVLETLRSDTIGDGMAARLADSMAQLCGVMRTVMAVEQPQKLN
jgi:hypothetical protein